MRTGTLLALLLGPLPAQDPAAAPAEKPPAVAVELLRRVPYGTDGLPALAMHAYGTNVRRLAVPAGGARVFADFGGRVVELPAERGGGEVVAEGRGVALVGAAGGRALLFDGRVATVAGDGSFTPLELPELTDAFVSPDGTRLLATSLENGDVRTLLHDLRARTKRRAWRGGAHASAIAWSRDGGCAVALASFDTSGGEPSEGLRAFAADGGTLLQLPAARAPVHALDVTSDGRHLVYADDRIRLVALDGGKEIASTASGARFWASIGEGMAVSHDGSTIAIRSETTLERVQEHPLGETRPAGAPAAVPGVVLATAVDGDRTLLAIATFEGLRLYRIRRGA
jgi:hypothetical protein